MKIWAKGNGQTLDEHITRCLKVWDSLWLSHTKVYSCLAVKMGLSSGNELNFLVRETIVCHDLGKGTTLWQKYIRDERKRGKITHAFFSFYLYGEAKGWPRNNLFLASALAVLGHHQLLYNNVFAGERVKGMGKIAIFTQELENILGIWLKDIKGLPPQVIGFEGADRVQKAKMMVERLPENKGLQFKSLYSFLLAMLTYVDYLASAGKKIFSFSLTEIWSGFTHSEVVRGTNDLQNTVREKIKKGKRNLLIQGGCGSGKTGAALLACHGLIEAGEVNKLIFTLPTKFTSNSMYWDFIEPEKYGFQAQDVGVYHSEVESMLAREWDGEDEDYLKVEKIINCWYAKPLNISTIDHLLYSLLHCYRYSDRAFGHLQTSLIVFDEIHYYDPLLLAKIGQCLFILRELSIPHIIMSATLPISFQSALQKASDNQKYELVQITEIDTNACKVTLENEPLIKENKLNPKLINLVREHINLKQMIVVNQVERAKAVAKELQEQFQDVNIICYHSQFTRTDRELKERLIKIVFKEQEKRSDEEVLLLSQEKIVNNQQIILVTTQICELSLDISSHIMYSEIAPIDSLIQRAGRLHRRGKGPSPPICGCEVCKKAQFPPFFSYQLHIFPVNWENSIEILPYNENILKTSWSILENSEGFLSSNAAIQWVNDLYPEEPRLADYKMEEMVMEDLVFGRTPKERYGDEDEENSQGSFKAREDILPTLMLVPKELYSPLEDLEVLLKERGIRVGRKKAFAQREKLQLENGIYILDIPYNKQYGLEFLR
ncbi:MAG: hypothetical protein VR72_10900 [Clostridiaceae bacterium BRH_c20a]|nr:MAG: hypothetical protein VR72_10900 [Clostridiaceae bacterium BRH_c20a]